MKKLCIFLVHNVLEKYILSKNSKVFMSGILKNSEDKPIIFLSNKLLEVTVTMRKISPILCLGLITLASCSTEHLRRDPSSVGECHLYIENLDQMVSFTPEMKEEFNQVAQQHEWHMVYDKHDLKEGDYVVSDFIKSAQIKKISYNPKYFYYVPYEKGSEVSFDNSYELKKIEVGPVFGSRGRSVASYDFKKSYPADSFGSQDDDKLTHSKWADQDKVASLFQDFVAQMPKCSEI